MVAIDKELFELHSVPYSSIWFVSCFSGKESIELFCFEWLKAVCTMDGVQITFLNAGGRSKLSGGELTVLQNNYQ
jgi:hypothetical protein